MDHVSGNLSDIREKIGAACRKAGRAPDSVELIAVSKTFPAESIRAAADAGQVLFGESRLQEAEPKITALPSSLRWHFIGRVQTNKVRKILPLFEAVHAIDSLRLATFTDNVASELGLFPKGFLQVNLAGEETKGGFGPDELEQAMETLLALPRLEIQGLMSIPPPGPHAESSRKWFSGLREFRDKLEAKFSTKLPALSMGMSGDYEVAVEEGATHVRVGSAIFGKRTYRVDGELG
jgi:pyridoxal phosphate enzyme (YggS family)